MPATQERWTAAAVRALPDDGKRYELIDGELLVTPSPRALHQAVVVELLVRLHEYVRREKIGVVLASPADLELEPGGGVLSRCAQRLINPLYQPVDSEHLLEQDINRYEMRRSDWNRASPAAP